MGSCCISTKQNQSLQSKIQSALEYFQKIQLKIHITDKTGKKRGIQVVDSQLTRPSVQSQANFNLQNLIFQVSSCILPGQDPRNLMDKQCQDTCSFFELKGIFFTILFDGHGKQGRNVAEFCKSFMLNFCQQHLDSFQNTPQQTLLQLVEICDQTLKKSKINTDLSGCTAVVIIYFKSHLYIGSVGDSRAILASLPKQDSIQPQPQLKAKPFVRPVEPKRKLEAIQLTTQQKPNHAGELERIANSGGVVHQLSDQNGQPVGPYRVWLKDHQIPGLAMSRSIGDKIANKAGVIPTPILHTAQIVPEADQFIVIASDGV